MESLTNLLSFHTLYNILSWVIDNIDSTATNFHHLPLLFRCHLLLPPLFDIFSSLFSEIVSLHFLSLFSTTFAFPFTSFHYFTLPFTSYHHLYTSFHILPPHSHFLSPPPTTFAFPFTFFHHLRTSFHFLSPHFTPFHLLSPPFVSFHLLSSPFISFHLLLPLFTSLPEFEHFQPRIWI